MRELVRLSESIGSIVDRYNRLVALTEQSHEDLFLAHGDNVLAACEVVKALQEDVYARLHSAEQVRFSAAL